MTVLLMFWAVLVTRRFIPRARLNFAGPWSEGLFFDLYPFSSHRSLRSLGQSSVRRPHPAGIKLRRRGVDRSAS